ncbi:FtsX-like permease family protein [Salininema proteolyticum]|uniref:FtsX-like permease family protein n=1 Tax=Salininema proteolyticum TaxID=1607685 RepID=A0ABV8U1G6_9ACTN
MSSLLGPSIHMAHRGIAGLVAVGCAALGGTAAATVAGVVVDTGLRSHADAELTASADAVVASPQSFAVDEDLDIPFPDRVAVPREDADALASLEGVTAAAVETGFDFAVLDAAGDPVEAPGHGWDIAVFADPGVADLAPGPGEIVLDTEVAERASVAPGEEVTVFANGSETTAVLTAVVDLPGAGAYAPQPEASDLAGPVDYLAVRTDDLRGLEAAASDLGLMTETGSGLGEVEELTGSERGELIAVGASLGGTLLLLIGFIIAGAVSASVTGQRRDIALLRAVGATPREVRRMVAAQATVVASLAFLPGAALGYVLADGFASLLAAQGLMGDDIAVVRGPLPALAALALVVAVVQISARTASLRISRIPATEAVSESPTEPRRPAPFRLAAGAALMGLALSTTVVPVFTRSEAAFASVAGGILPAVIGLALAGPFLVRFFAVRLLRRVSARPVAWLAMAHSEAFALRTASTATILALAMGLAITQFAAKGTMVAVIGDELADGTEDVTATVTAPALGGVPREDTAELRGLGVEAAAYGATTVIVPGESDGKATGEAYPATVLGGADGVVDPRVAEGDLDGLTGDAVAVGSTAAWLHDVGVGDGLELVLADGRTVEPTVVAVYERSFGFGPFLLSEDLAGAAGRSDVVLASGSGAVVRDWARNVPGAVVEDGFSLGAGTGGRDWVSIAVALAIVGYVLLGVGNNLVAATSRRRGEFRGLRLIGMTPRQIRAMVRREALFVGAFAAVAAFALSVVPMGLLNLAFTGVPWPEGPWWLVPGALSFVTALAYIAIMAAARCSITAGPRRRLRWEW